MDIYTLHSFFFSRLFFFAVYIRKNTRIVKMTEEKLLQQSEELDFSRLETITHQKPFDVFYMTQTASSWHEGGFSFNLTSPSYNALLSRDVWVEYNFYLTETVAGSITDQFQDTGVSPDPQTNQKFCFRGGNVIARSIRELSMRLNGLTTFYYPAYYMDVWNRIHVSNKMSEHEFSASGGKFDDGNHGHRTDNVEYADGNAAIFDNQVPDLFVIANADVAHGNNTALVVHLYDGHIPLHLTERAFDFSTHLRPAYPLKYEYYNLGFSNRYSKFSYMVRNGADSTDEDMEAVVGNQFSLSATPEDPNLSELKVTLFERLPIPIFKMYMLDGIEGVIPHINSLVINASFVNPVLSSMLKSNFYPFNSAKISFENISPADLKIHMKWYSPTFTIPKQIKLNSPRFSTWYTPITGISTNTFLTKPYKDFDLSINGITIPSIPDVMFIYIKYDPMRMTSDVPDDYNLEIVNSYFTLNAANSKILNLQSIQMYNLWKNHLKYNPENAIGYDEWRKFCFVLVLKPEDFGIKKMSEYNDVCIINFKGTARNWYHTPSVWHQDAEELGGAIGAEANLVFVCHAVYYRNVMELTPDRCFEYLKTM